MNEIILTVVLILTDLAGAVMTVLFLDRLFYTKKHIFRNIFFIIIGLSMCIASIGLAERIL